MKILDGICVCVIAYNSIRLNPKGDTKTHHKKLFMEVFLGFYINIIVKMVKNSFTKLYKSDNFIKMELRDFLSFYLTGC